MSPFTPLALALVAGWSSAPALADAAADAGRAHAHEGLPFLDIRLHDGLPTPVVRKAAAGALARQTPGVDRLRALVPGLRIDRDEMLGAAGSVGSPLAPLTPGVAMGGGAMRGVRPSPRQVVADFLAEYVDVFEVTPALLSGARVTRDMVTASTGVTHLTFQQQFSGLDVLGCELRASVTPTSGLVHLACTMLPLPDAGLPGEVEVGEIQVGEVEALLLGMLSAGVSPADLPRPDAGRAGPALTPGETFWTTPDLRADEPVTTRRVFFPLTRETIRPAWLVVVPVPGEGHTYDIVIDAIDGAILKRTDRLVRDSTLPMTFRVYTGASPSPLFPGRETPDGFQPPFVLRDLITIQPAEITPFSRDGWIPDSGVTTLGNNVAAHLDLNSDNVADLPRPSGGPERTFDFPIDLTQPPSASRQAGVAQGFYLANRFHDRLYALGFDEAAGNFQTSNFGRGGVGGDAIQLDCLDGSGADNANFNGGGVDGSGARIQMYAWSGPHPDRDGVFDAMLVFHEFAHGLSIRLHGGLENIAQPGGLGEGWSDFFGLSLCALPGDDPAGVSPFSPFVAPGLFGRASFRDNYYFGIRRYPYSVDLAKNPLTLADIDPRQVSLPASPPLNPAYGSLANLADEVHNAGEVWCSALWQARALLHERLGPSANEAMMQLVVDGMKLSPSNPTFLQARDAVLAAEVIRSRGAGADALWRGFALRGMGEGASVPAATINTGVVESFAIPRTVLWTYPDGLPGPRAAGEPSTIRLTAAPVGVVLVPGSVTLHWAIDDGPFTQAPVEAGSAEGEFRALLPAANCGSVVRYYFSAQTSEGERLDPPGAPQAARRAAAGAESLRLSDAFDSDQGWTVGPDTAGEGRWERADPAGYSNAGRVVQPADDHTPGPGGACFVTGRSFFQQLTYGRTRLTSPPIDLSGTLDAQVSYWRWYVNGAGLAPYQNRFTVEVSPDNGASWRQAEVVGPGSAHDPNVNGGWRFASWRLSTLGLAPTPALRVRFTAENNFGGSFIFAAVDDFAVSVVTCPPPPACRPDVNGDGALDPDDLADFITCFFSIAACPRADWDGDGEATPDDLADYIAAYFAGCP